MIGEFLDSTVRSEEKLPSIPRRVTADLRWIFHDNCFRRTLPQRQFLHTQVFYIGAGVPVSMERKDQPILIVDESRLNFVFHVGRLAVQFRAKVRSLYRLAVL